METTVVLSKSSNAVHRLGTAVCCALLIVVAVGTIISVVSLASGYLVQSATLIAQCLEQGSPIFKTDHVKVFVLDIEKKIVFVSR